MDPGFITSADWQAVANLLHFFWFILICAIGTGFNFLLAHAIIPSLVGTGHIPQRVDNSRRFFYAGALGSFSLMLFCLFRALSEVRILGEFWGRFWM